MSRSLLASTIFAPETRAVKSSKPHSLKTLPSNTPKLTGTSLAGGTDEDELISALDDALLTGGGADDETIGGSIEAGALDVSTSGASDADALELGSGSADETETASLDDMDDTSTGKADELTLLGALELISELTAGGAEEAGASLDSSDDDPSSCSYCCPAQSSTFVLRAAASTPTTTNTKAAAPQMTLGNADFGSSGKVSPRPVRSFKPGGWASGNP